jgi:hypothetical protein
MPACQPGVAGPTESSIAVDSTAVYWANAVVIDPVAPGSLLRSGTIVRAPLPGSAASSVTVLASGQNAPNNVAADVTRVYWTNHGMNGLPGQVMMAPK